MQQYETDMRQGDLPKAWHILSAEQQARERSFDDFVRSRTQQLREPEMVEFSILGTDSDREVVASWIRTASIGTADVGRAVVVQVEYPGLKNNAGWAAYLVGPDADGQDRIWLLR